VEIRVYSEPQDQYIKFLNGDLVPIEGSNTIDKQILNDLRIPYKQLLRSRIIFKTRTIRLFTQSFRYG
jgi:hypothetical protein